MYSTINQFKPTNRIAMVLIIVSGFKCLNIWIDFRPTTVISTCIMKTSGVFLKKYTQQFQSIKKNISLIWTQNLKASNENLDNFLLYKISTISDSWVRDFFYKSFGKLCFSDIS